MAAALVADLGAHGGRVLTSSPVTDLAQVRPADVVLLDLTPRQVLAVAGHELPARYARAMRRWRYGAGAHKVDYLLDGPVPWSDPRVADAGSVHLGGTAEEVLRSGAGVLVAPEDPAALLAAARGMAADPAAADRLGARGPAYVDAHLGREAGLARIDALIDEALAR